jgi:YfiH family protein
MNNPAPLPGKVTVSALDRMAGVRHAFFTREGGYSSGGYAALNCGFSTGDDRVSVQANRDLALAQFGLPPDRLAALHQIHSNKILVIDANGTQGPLEQADGLVTKRCGIALAVLGADCAPILLADEKAGVIGAAHAGWRGAVSGVIENVVATMIGLGAEPARMTAAVGPCIAQDSYEVGPEFPGPFLAADQGNDIFFARAARPGHWMFDLPGFIASRLSQVMIGTVVRTPCDTFQQEDRFFSHRRAQLRGEAACGRQLSAIALEH